MHPRTNSLAKNMTARETPCNTTTPGINNIWLYV